MKKTIYPTTLFLVLFLFQSAHLNLEWGFFGHRLINRMAVFTLPPGMMIFYKKNIEYVSDHAVDPDKRRYATKHEAVRHYIDLDIWGEYPFENFPRTQIGALMKYTDVFVIDKQNDTTLVLGNELRIDEDKFFIKFRYLENKEVVIPKKKFQSFFYNNILAKYYDDVWELDLDSFQLYFDEFFPTSNGYKVIAEDKFSEYGVLPFHLMRMQNKLTKAFENKDEFSPHMMYDPETKKGYKAKTYDDHMRMKKLGYVHDLDELGPAAMKRRKRMQDRLQKTMKKYGDAAKMGIPADQVNQRRNAPTRKKT